MELILSFLFVWILVIYTIYHFSTAHFGPIWERVKVKIGNESYFIYYCVADESSDAFDNISGRLTTYYLKDEATRNSEFMIVCSVSRSFKDGDFETRRHYHVFCPTRGEEWSRLKPIAFSEDRVERQKTFDSIVEQIEDHRFGYRKCPYKIG